MTRIAKAAALIAAAALGGSILLPIANAWAPEATSVEAAVLKVDANGDVTVAEAAELLAEVVDLRDTEPVEVEVVQIEGGPTATEAWGTYGLYYLAAEGRIKIDSDAGPGKLTTAIHELGHHYDMTQWHLSEDEAFLDAVYSTAAYNWWADRCAEGSEWECYATGVRELAARAIAQYVVPLQDFPGDWWYAQWSPTDYAPIREYLDERIGR